jgi:hypothetical protein
MISIINCDSYKYYGCKLPVHYGKPWYQYRDNMLYLCLSFSDWQNDQQMLKSLLDAHVTNLPFDYVAQAIQPFVVDNQTCELHCVIWQKDDLDNFQLKFSLTKQKPVAVQVEGQEPIMVDDYVASMRAFYAAEMKRRDDEEDAVEEQQKQQEIARAARKQKRLANEARRLAQGEQVPVVKKPTKKG